ncbi:MAG: PASTA domain-containing protein, partial [Rikenellaceae bacterium]
MAKEREYSFIQKIKFALEENFVVRNVVLAVSIFVIAAILVFWSLNLFTRHGERLTVPNFSDMTIEQAIEASKEFDLEFMVIDSLHITKKPKGVILEQYPKPGNFVKKGRRIFITTNSFTPKMIPIPYVAGFSLRQAKNKIVGSGFVIDKITYKEDLATFNVLKQTYANKEITAGKEVMAEMGSGISLV